MIEFGKLIVEFIYKACIAFLIIAAADYGVTKWKFLKDQKMSFKEIKDYVKNMSLIIDIVVYVFSVLLLFIIFLVEGNKFKKHKEFFSYLSSKNIDIKAIINSYLLFYLICSLIYIKKLDMFIIYLVVYLFFYIRQVKKIRSCLGP